MQNDLGYSVDLLGNKWRKAGQTNGRSSEVAQLKNIYRYVFNLIGTSTFIIVKFILLLHRFANNSLSKTVQLLYYLQNCSFCTLLTASYQIFAKLELGSCFTDLKIHILKLRSLIIYIIIYSCKFNTSVQSIWILKLIVQQDIFTLKLGETKFKLSIFLCYCSSDFLSCGSLGHCLRHLDWLRRILIRAAAAIHLTITIARELKSVPGACHFSLAKLLAVTASKWKVMNTLHPTFYLTYLLILFISGVIRRL